MATPKQVMDFRPSKGITTAQSNEHQRRWTEKGWGSAESTGNYDRSRERLNFEVRGGKVCPIDKSRSIPERMADILRSRGIKDPNEGLAEPRFRTVVNFIFGGSRERMTELAFGDQKVNLTHGADNSHLTRCKDIEEWAKDVYRFVADKYGEENIVAFILHLDETNPHVHCTLLPIKDGKFAYKQIFAGKDKYEFFCQDESPGTANLPMSTSVGAWSAELPSQRREHATAPPKNTAASCQNSAPPLSSPSPPISGHSPRSNRTSVWQSGE